MNAAVVVNKTGRPGDGLFYDKFCEHCVRSVKTCLRNCHGAVDALLLEKSLNGLSMASCICQHDRASVLRDEHGKEASHDYVGERVRNIMEEMMATSDPFSREREQHLYREKPRGSPYSGLEESELVRFLVRLAEMYGEKY